MATVSLRPMSTEDIAAARSLEQMAYTQPWSETVFADELALSSRRYLAAEVDGRMVGYAGIMLVDTEAHITTVVVHPDHRKARLGTRLVLALVEAALEAGAVSLTLEVRRSNESAQALYRRFGLAPVGVRKAYYQDEDALIMWAHDIDGPEYRALLDAIRRELG
jgi:[ribosomal protein S18]-alanine N-acetyltransferase